MSANKATLRLNELDKALTRLDEILATPLDHIGRVDAIIQRFEFCYELMWKSAKACLENQGIVVNSPRETLQKSYAMKWIDDEKLWLSMLDDRNMTSHTYHETTANDIVGRIPAYLDAMKQFKTRLLSV